VFSSANWFDPHLVDLRAGNNDGALANDHSGCSIKEQFGNSRFRKPGGIPVDQIDRIARAMRLWSKASGTDTL
jgi:hypothetical protein